MINKKQKPAEYMTGTGTMLKFENDPGEQKLKEAAELQTISFLLTEGFLNHCLDYANRMLNEDELKFYHRTKDFWEGYKTACNYWFEYCKKYCSDYPPKMRKPTTAEKKTFKYIEKLKNNEDFEWPLIGIIDYRNDKIPVYDDDAGQCYFCRLPNGKTICGGGWNPDPEDEFCFEWDRMKDEIKF